MLKVIPRSVFAIKLDPFGYLGRKLRWNSKLNISPSIHKARLFNRKTDAKCSMNYKKLKGTIVEFELYEKNTSTWTTTS